MEVFFAHRVVLGLFSSFKSILTTFKSLGAHLRPILDISNFSISSKDFGHFRPFWSFRANHLSDLAVTGQIRFKTTTNTPQHRTSRALRPLLSSNLAKNRFFRLFLRGNTLKSNFFKIPYFRADSAQSNPEYRNKSKI